MSGVCKILQTENMLDMMTLTAGLTTNSTEESAVSRHLHITVSQSFDDLSSLGLGAPEAMPSQHMHLHKRSQRQSLQLLPITLQSTAGLGLPHTLTPCTFCSLK
jgi:hypothetical protein